jgi:hypothetical protein
MATKAYDVISEKSQELSVSVGVGGKISSLTYNLGTTDLRLSWAKSKDPDVVRYDVFYGFDGINYNGTGLSYVGNSNPNPEESPIMVPVSGNSDTEFNAESPSIFITNLTIFQPYWFGIKAVDSQGRSSDIVIVTDVNQTPINITPKGGEGAAVDVRVPGNIKLVVYRTTKGIKLDWQHG